MEKTTTSQITLLFFLALGLGYSSTLRTAQQHKDVDHEKEIKAINTSPDHIKGNNTNNQQAKPITATQNDQALQNEDNEALRITYDIIEQVDWSCKSIKSCKALSRIIACLQTWQAINNDMRKLGDIVKELSSENNYKELLGAYHHLLDVHLNGKNNKEAFKFINDRIKQNITCAFPICKGYDRNQRDRVKESVETKQIKQYGQDLIFIRDTLDTIHAYLIHGSDSGHLYVKETKLLQENKGFEDDGDDEKDDEADSNYTLVDQEMAALAAWQGAKKKTRTQEKTKFNTTLEDVFKSEKKIITEVDHLIQTKAKAAQEVEKNKKTASYGFGVRLYYWEQYKDNTNIDHDYNPGDRYCDRYVPPAFPSLKKEILAKNVPIGTWEQKIYAAKRVLSLSATLRKSKAVGLYKPYGIKKGAPLAAKHILAILLYTDLTDLCTAFGRSFWCSSVAGIQDIVKKNAKWHHLAKYLREVVECFGTRIDGKAYDETENAYKQVIDIKGDTYYHGVSYLLFTRFSVNWYGPLSTSKQLEVATLFTASTDNGLILDLKEDNNSLRFFNVSFLSAFSSEDERLFIGGYQPIQIASIRLLKDNINLENIMHALFIVNSIIRGKEPGGKNKALRVDRTVYKHLIAKKTDMPPYAQQIWDQFRHQQQRILIDIYYIYNYYKKFIPKAYSSKHKYLLFSTECKNLLRFDEITKAFPNVTEIVCKRTDYDGYKAGYFADIVSPNFLEGLKASLSKVDQQAKLRKIIIQTREHQVKENSSLYVKLFDPLGWQTGQGTHTIVISKESYREMYQEVTTKIAAMIKSEKSSYEVTSLDARILAQLMAKKHVSLAVQQKWKAFCNAFQTVKINIRHMYKYYRLFAQHLSDKKCKNLLLFDQIANMFPNVTEMICENTDWDENKQNEWGIKGSYSAAIVNAAFIARLKDKLQAIDKQVKLKKVIISTSQHEVKDDLDVYATQFKKLGWQIKKKHKQITLTNLYRQVGGLLQQVAQRPRRKAYWENSLNNKAQNLNDAHDEENVDLPKAQQQRKASKIDKAKQQETALIQATCHFVAAVQGQLAQTPVPAYLGSAQWNANAAATFVAAVLCIFRKQQYPHALSQAEHHGIPTSLVPFIKTYISSHPQLQQVAQRPDFCKSHLEKPLVFGQIDQLRAHSLPNAAKKDNDKEAKVNELIKELPLLKTHQDRAEALYSKLRSADTPQKKLQLTRLQLEKLSANRTPKEKFASWISSKADKLNHIWIEVDNEDYLPLLHKLKNALLAQIAAQKQANAVVKNDNENPDDDDVFDID